jgi:hypothetical protein
MRVRPAIVWHVRVRPANMMHAFVMHFPPLQVQCSKHWPCCPRLLPPHCTLEFTLLERINAATATQNRTRWFRLLNTSLSYYTKDSGELIASVPISEIDSVESVSRYQLRVHTRVAFGRTDKQEMILEAPSEVVTITPPLSLVCCARRSHNLSLLPCTARIVPLTISCRAQHTSRLSCDMHTSSRHPLLLTRQRPSRVCSPPTLIHAHSCATHTHTPGGQAAMGRCTRNCAVRVQHHGCWLFGSAVTRRHTHW